MGGLYKLDYFTAADICSGRDGMLNVSSEKSGYQMTTLRDGCIKIFVFCNLIKCTISTVGKI